MNGVQIRHNFLYEVRFKEIYPFSNWSHKFCWMVLKTEGEMVAKPKTVF